MTALALAGTGGGGVAPELDSGPTAVERAPRPALLAATIDEPAVGGQEPALSRLAIGTSGEAGVAEDAPPVVDPCEAVGATPSPGTLGLPGAVASLEDQLAALRPVAAERVRRFLTSRGNVARFVRAEAIDAASFYRLLRRVCRRGGPLAEAIDARQDGVRGADLVPCTRCGLRGHVAGDPDRCLRYHGSYGLGGAAAIAMGEAPWRNPTAGGGDR